jgi:citrate lyase subunit beta/citryl-CoA lyase
MIRRSSLFVPAHVPRFVQKAGSAGADAVILDLEDAVPADQKDAARAGLPEAVAKLTGTVVVRVNSGDALADDIEACARAGVQEILLPKADGPEDVLRFRELCRGAGFEPALSVLIETTRGLARMAETLACGPIATMALGVEDLRVELEPFAPDGAPESATLMHIHVTAVLAAMAAGVVPLGLIGPIGNISDLDRLRAGAAAAWRMGYRGTLCIHPSQVPVHNAEYAPSAGDLAWAEAVAEGAAEAAKEGRGAFVVDGAMVDAPLVERAARIMRLAGGDG